MFHACNALQVVSASYTSKLTRVALLEFDRDRKSSSVIVSGGQPATGRTRAAAASSNVLLVKGAAECVIERCDRMMLPDGKVRRGAGAAGVDADHGSKAR